MTHRAVWFWREIHHSLREFCRVKRLPFNRVVNLAVSEFLKSSCNVEELRLQLRLEELTREENELRRFSRVMLRSGSFLPQYAQKLLREPGRPVSLVRDGQVPLKALSLNEEQVIRRILAKREAIAKEMAEILDQLLPEKRFRLKPEPRRLRSRARDKSKPFGKGGA